MDSLHDIEIEFWSILSLAVMVLIGLFLKDFVATQLSRVFKRFFNNHTNKFKVQREINEIVYRELSHLRNKSNGSRTYVLQFHNGEHFFPENPRFKITQTYVTTAPGFDKGSKFKDLDSTLVADIVSAIFGENTDDIQGIRHLKVKHPDTEVIFDADCIYVAVVKELSSDKGMTKTIMQERGVEAFVFTPVKTATKEVIGILAISYCEYDYWDRINNPNFDKALIKDVSNTIGLQFSEKRKSFFHKLTGK